MQVERDAAAAAPVDTPTISLTVTPQDTPGVPSLSATLALPASGLPSYTLALTIARSVDIEVTVGGVAVSAGAQTVEVQPGAADAASATFALASAAIAAGETVELTAQANDAYGNALPAGGDLFQCDLFQCPQFTAPPGQFCPIPCVPVPF